MHSRTQCKKDAKGQYDPQVGEAAAANAAIAERAQAWSEGYFEKYISPLLQQQVGLNAKADARQDQLFSDNKESMDLAKRRYREQGLPAEDAYYDMVKKYSEPEFADEMARTALGDAAAAEASATGDMRRRMQAMGVDPSSPAALSAMSDFAVQSAATRAAAQTKARDAARTLGMTLKSDAANFGRGGASAVLNFGQAASGNSTVGAGLNAQALQGANAGAGVVQNGFGLGLKGYGANLDAYTQLNKQSMETQAASAGGFGNFLGTVAGAAIGKWSDRRLKTNITKLYHSTSGYGVYEFNYTWEPNGAPKHIGVMADEVERVVPDAVSVDPSGYKRVDYSKVII